MAGSRGDTGEGNLGESCAGVASVGLLDLSLVGAFGQRQGWESASVSHVSSCCLHPHPTTVCTISVCGDCKQWHLIAPTILERVLVILPPFGKCFSSENQLSILIV